jgi:hypothetical protein
MEVGDWFGTTKRLQCGLLSIFSARITLLAVSSCTAPPLDLVNQFQNYARCFYIPVTLTVWTIIIIVRYNSMRSSLLWLHCSGYLRSMSVMESVKKSSMLTGLLQPTVFEPKSFARYLAGAPPQPKASC